MMDLLNQRFGKWTVISISRKKPSGYLWNCRCECGAIREVSLGNLRRGGSTKCMECRARSYRVTRSNVRARKCNKCGFKKPSSQFYRNSYNRGTGLLSRCKICISEISKTPEYKRRVSNYVKSRMLQDPIFRVRVNLGKRLAKVLNGASKSKPTMVLIGCGLSELRTHLERQFRNGMSWGNYGFGTDRWHVDHIVPCAQFDLTNPKHQKRCFHFTNLQPLWQS